MEIVLGFRDSQWNELEVASYCLQRSVENMIITACGVLVNEPNFYTNPISVTEYTDIKLVYLEVNDNLMEMIINKANDCNTSVELYVIEAVKTYQMMLSRVREKKAVY